MFGVDSSYSRISLFRKHTALIWWIVSFNLHGLSQYPTVCNMYSSGSKAFARQDTTIYMLTIELWILGEVSVSIDVSGTWKQLCRQCNMMHQCFFFTRMYQNISIISIPYQKNLKMFLRWNFSSSVKSFKRQRDGTLLYFNLSKSKLWISIKASMHAVLFSVIEYRRLTKTCLTYSYVLLWTLQKFLLLHAQRILLDVYYCYAKILLCMRTHMYWFMVIAIKWYYMQSILRLLQKYSITPHCFLFTTFLMLKFWLIYTCMLFNAWTSIANSREKHVYSK